VPARLGERHRRRGDLRLELPNVELRCEALGEALARDVERRLARAERALGDRLLLIELEQLQIARRDIAHERERRRALVRLLRAEVGARGLDIAADASPEIELPREIRGEARGTIADRWKGA